jgi:uncharacterized membrane protein
LPSVFAQVYELEFQQVYDKVVVKEKIAENNFNYLEVLNLEESGGHYFFTYKYNFPGNYTSADVVFLVDNGFVANGIFPQGYSVNGNEIRWNVSAEKPFAIFLNLEKKNNYVWVAIVLFVIVLALVYFKFRKKKIVRKVSGVKKKIDYAFLLDEERKIVEMLKKSKRNEMWQNNIMKDGGFSKAKTSRLIRNLESRGLVKKISFGNTNKIVLK